MFVRAILPIEDLGWYSQGKTVVPKYSCDVGSLDKAMRKLLSNADVIIKV